jgi:hypothetical protein
MSRYFMGVIAGGLVVLIAVLLGSTTLSKRAAPGETELSPRHSIFIPN